MSNALSLAVTLDEEPDVEAALRCWEALERPITRHTQRWTYLWGLSSAAFPPSMHRIRSGVVSRAAANPWIGRQITRTARYTPTGTESHEGLPTGAARPRDRRPRARRGTER
jgi:hypothetical protein